MNAGELFVLQYLSDHVFESNIGTDGKLAYSIAVLIGVDVSPEILLELFVVALGLDQAIALHPNGQRRPLQIATLDTQIVTHQAVNYIRATHFAGRGEDLSAGKVPPLVRTDESAGL